MAPMATAATTMPTASTSAPGNISISNATEISGRRFVAAVLSLRPLQSVDQGQEPASRDGPRVFTGRRRRLLAWMSRTEAIRVLEREFCGPLGVRKSRSIVCLTRRFASSSRLLFVLPVLITAPMRNWYFHRPGSIIAISYSIPLWTMALTRSASRGSRPSGRPTRSTMRRKEWFRDLSPDFSAAVHDAY